MPRAVPVLVLLAVVSSALAALPAAAEDWSRHLPGVYDGEIFSGTANLKAVTEFEAGADGITGRYEFTEDTGEKTTGRLSQCRSIKPHTLVCRWQDRYGAGTLAMRFETNLQEFEGVWNSDAAPRDRAPWWGKRQITS